MVAVLLALSFITTYAASNDAFSYFDVVAIVGLGAALNGAVLLALLLCLRPGWLANALLAALTVLGVATTHAIHAELTQASAHALWLLLGAAGFALFVAFGVVDRSRWFGPISAVLALATLAAFAADRWHRENTVVKGDTSNIRHVEFRRRPNLYFVSFDAIAPRALLRKYMGVETTPLHDVIDARFSRFKNFFANAIYTKNSLNLLLALDERAYDTMIRMKYRIVWRRYPSLFSGEVPSPLFDILKKNGYETTTLFGNTYFGERKGPFVDRYFTFQERTVCNLLDPAIRPVSFWGYCPLVEANRQDSQRPPRQVTDLLIDRLSEVSRHDGPQFAMAHIYEPGHTARSFRYRDEAQLSKYRAQYLDGSAFAAKLLARLLHHLDENDPDAILLVYGDHGPFLAQGVAFEHAPEFVVQDYYGILGGIYPAGACAEWFDEPRERQGYLTLLDAAHAVLRCLSGGEWALHQVPHSYRIGNWHRKVPRGAGMTYEKFIYE